MQINTQDWPKCKFITVLNWATYNLTLFGVNIYFITLNIYPLFPPQL